MKKFKNLSFYKRVIVIAIFLPLIGVFDTNNVRSQNIMNDPIKKIYSDEEINKMDDLIRIQRFSLEKSVYIE